MRILTNHLNQLESMNGTCECESITRLYLIKQEASELEKKCDFLNIKTNPQNNPGSSSLRRYSILVKKFEEKVEEYYGEILRLLADTNALELQCYNKNHFKPTKKITLVELQEVDTKNFITTINCSACGQQIDVLF